MTKPISTGDGRGATRSRLAPAWIIFGIATFLWTWPSATGASEFAMTNQFVQSRDKFDRFLEMRQAQAEVETLCDQYAASLEKLLASAEGASPYFKKCIQDEMSRAASARALYLSSKDQFRRIQLDYFWTQNLTHKAAVADFRKVLGVAPGESAPTERPDIRRDFGKGATLFGLPWLSPVDKYLELFAGEAKNKTGSKTSVSMPGYPRGSFFYHAYNGEFTAFIDREATVPRVGAQSEGSPVRLAEVGRFNRMHLLTDSRDQVVGVQFSCEAPSRRPAVRTSNEIGVFNFVSFRRKAIHTTSYFRTEEFEEFYRIITLLANTSGRLLEVNVFYLPKPTAELIKFVLAHPN